MPTVDSRQPITPDLHQAIQDAFKTVPDDKRGALVILADTHGTRAHLAAKINNTWKVAVEAGKPWHGPVSGAVMLEGVW
jgi:hypothetical protein